jgi:O-antigen/teichoic acid export membrane protein
MGRRDGFAVARLVTLPAHVLVAASAWASRIAGGLAQLLVIRLLLPYLGDSQFALFSVVVSLSAWFALADFGLGSSLQNAISRARAVNESYVTLIQSALPILVLLFAASVMTVAAVATPLQGLLFRKLAAGGAASPYVIATCGAVFVVTALSTVSYRVFYAEGRGELANVFIALANLVGLLGVWLVTSIRPGGDPLLWALLAWVLPPAVMGLAACYRIYRVYALRSVRADVAVARVLFSRAWRFWGFAIMSAATLNLDYAIMSQTLSAPEIVEYNAAARIFNLIFFFQMALLQATWPACTEAFTRGDIVDVRRLIAQSLIVGFVLVVGMGSVVIIASDLASSVLLGSSGLVVSRGVLVLFAVYYLLRVWCDTFAMVLQSQNHLRVLWAYIPVQAAVSVGAQIGLSRWLGVQGILLGIILSFVATAVWALPLSASQLMRNVDPRGES